MENIKKKFIKVHTKSSHTILSSALTWFGIGIIIVLSLGYAFVNIPLLETFFSRISSSKYGFIGLTMIALATIIAIMFGMWKFSLPTLIALFFLFCIIQSIYIGYIFAIYAQNFDKLLIVFTIPAITFLGMGILGYLQIFNFGKLWKFLLLSVIGLIVFGIVLFFIHSSWAIMGYSILGYIVFSLYVGFDLWRISRMQQFYDAGLDMDKEAITRFGIVFGLSLLIDFIQLVWFMARIIR